MGKFSSKIPRAKSSSSHPLPILASKPEFISPSKKKINNQSDIRVKILDLLELDKKKYYTCFVATCLSNEVWYNKTQYNIIIYIMYKNSDIYFFF